MSQSSCTHIGCTCSASTANPGRPLQGRAERLPGRALPAAGPGTGEAKLFRSIQEENIPNNHGLRVFVCCREVPHLIAYVLPVQPNKI